MKKKKRDAAPKYEVRSDLRTLYIYKDRDWAVHSAECYASFYNIPVYVIDTTTGIVISLKYPSNFKKEEKNIGILNA